MKNAGLERLVEHLRGHLVRAGCGAGDQALQTGEPRNERDHGETPGPEHPSDFPGGPHPVVHFHQMVEGPQAERRIEGRIGIGAEIPGIDLVDALHHRLYAGRPDALAGLLKKAGAIGRPGRPGNPRRARAIV